MDYAGIQMEKETIHWRKGYFNYQKEELLLNEGELERALKRLTQTGSSIQRSCSRVYYLEY